MLKCENYQFLVTIFTNKKRCQLRNNLKQRLYFTEPNIGKFLPENARSYTENSKLDIAVLCRRLDLSHRDYFEQHQGDD